MNLSPAVVNLLAEEEEPTFRKCFLSLIFLNRSNEWVDNRGKKHLVLRFYLKGAYASGTVHLEVYEVSST